MRSVRRRPLLNSRAVIFESRTPLFALHLLGSRSSMSEGIHCPSLLVAPHPPQTSADWVCITLEMSRPMRILRPQEFHRARCNGRRLTAARSDRWTSVCYRSVALAQPRRTYAESTLPIGAGERPAGSELAEVCAYRPLPHVRRGRMPDVAARRERNCSCESSLPALPVESAGP